MSSFNTQHPIAKAFDGSAMNGEIASRGLAGISSTSSTSLHKDSAMRHSHTSRGLRTSAKALLSVVALGLATACSDSVSAPINEVSVKAPAGFTKVIGVSTFTYSPRNGVTKRIGEHVLVIPSGAVCDPATSGYGPSFWDQPCTTVKHPLVFTVTTYEDDNGRPFVHFQPSVRFSPDKEVNLYLKDGARQTAAELEINWCNDAGQCFNESLSDASVKTRRVGHSSILARRVKHFSGYVVFNVGDCPSGNVTPLDDGSGYMCDDGRGASRSGYMLASGLAKGGSSGAHRGKKYDQ
jgi:hypothetical protein